jgi:hypothetical protein
MKTILRTILLFLAFNSNASSLSEDAIERGINKICASYLSQIEETYKLDGLNVTFAYPESISIMPSLHISTQIYNNGSSSFSATLVPDEKYCYLSAVMVTSISNQSCSDVSKAKAEIENLQISSYADGGFIIMTPPDNSHQTILTSSGDNSCTMTEARMLWPGI